jgi:plasmid maintenance system antidote protein VapI
MVRKEFWMNCQKLYSLVEGSDTSPKYVGSVSQVTYDKAPKKKTA